MGSLEDCSDLPSTTTTIDLSGYGIRHMADGVFDRFTHLHTLDLSRNHLRLGSLRQGHENREKERKYSKFLVNGTFSVFTHHGVFNSLSTLRNLYLGTQDLPEWEVWELPRRLPENFFGGLTSLQILQISGNQLESIEARAFAGLDALLQLVSAVLSLTFSF
jgi:Leucine-rich repeat (LRR) protein